MRKNVTESVESFRTPFISKVEIFVIKRFYQPLLSPLVGNSCRFVPSCSNYGIAVLNKYSFIKANVKILWRIVRCQPFCRGGHDPA